MPDRAQFMIPGAITASGFRCPDYIRPGTWCRWKHEFPVRVVSHAGRRTYVEDKEGRKGRVDHIDLYVYAEDNITP